MTGAGGTGIISFNTMINNRCIENDYIEYLSKSDCMDLGLDIGRACMGQ